MRGPFVALEDIRLCSRLHGGSCRHHLFAHTAHRQTYRWFAKIL